MTTAAKTKDQIRAEAEALFADLLAPEPKTKAKPKAKDKPAFAAAFRRSDSLDIIRRPTATATLRIFTVTTQTCSTCGSIHSYTSAQHTRFEIQKRNDGLALETTAAAYLPEALAIPAAVRQTSETVEFCPTCLAMGEHITDFLATANNTPKQEELFK